MLGVDTVALEESSVRGWGDRDEGCGGGERIWVQIWQSRDLLCSAGDDREIEDLAVFDLWALQRVSIHLVVYYEPLCIQWERFGPR